MLQIQIRVLFSRVNLEGHTHLLECQREPCLDWELLIKCLVYATFLRVLRDGSRKNIDYLTMELEPAGLGVVQLVEYDTVRSRSS